MGTIMKQFHLSPVLTIYLILIDGTCSFVFQMLNVSAPTLHTYYLLCLIHRSGSLSQWNCPTTQIPLGTYRHFPWIMFFSHSKTPWFTFIQQKYKYILVFYTIFNVRFHYFKTQFSLMLYQIMNFDTLCSLSASTDSTTQHCMINVFIYVKSWNTWCFEITSFYMVYK